MSWSGPYVFWVIGFGIATAVVHAAFAYGVFRDALMLRDRGAGPSIVGPSPWGLATLVGGVPVAIGYWLIHHSTLRRSDLAGGIDAVDERQPET